MKADNNSSVICDSGFFQKEPKILASKRLANVDQRGEQWRRGVLFFDRILACHAIQTRSYLSDGMYAAIK